MGFKVLTKKKPARICPYLLGYVLSNHSEQSGIYFWESSQHFRHTERVMGRGVHWGWDRSAAVLMPVAIPAC